MAMWKIIVSPDEDKYAWDKYLQDGIVAIGWCDRKWETASAVRQFKQIADGDLVVAHLPEKRSGMSFLAVGVGIVTSEYLEVNPKPSENWNGSFRRQFKVNWVSNQKLQMPDLLKQCRYRATVCKLNDSLAGKILDRYNLYNLF